MRILITGAKGFVGTAIAAELSAAHDLFLLDRPESEKNKYCITNTPGIVEADITDARDLQSLDIGPVDAVIHAAGLAHQFGPVTKEAFWKVNVEGTENAVKLAARLKAGHFILISSVSVYGPARDGVSLRTEETECAPEGLYAESKLESEIVAAKVCEQNGIDLTILRLATVIGEGDAGNVGRLVRSIDRRRFLWVGKGENRKSLVYKGDVARACAAVLKRRPAGANVFNISAEPATMKEIVISIERALGKKTPAISIGPSLLRAGFKVNSATVGIDKITRVSETVEKWLSDETFSAEKIEKECGFRAETSIGEAIRREVKWYLGNK